MEKIELIKNYLTSEELVVVVNTLKEIESATTREIVKYGLIYQLLVKDIPQLDTCDEYADLYFAQTDIDFDIDCNNVYLIDKILEKEFSVEKTVKDFLIKLDNKIDEFGKTIDYEQTKVLLEQFKYITNKKEVE